MIRGISVASIPVRNQDTALKFYTEKLGFKESVRPLEQARLMRVS